MSLWVAIATSKAYDVVMGEPNDSRRYATADVRWVPDPAAHGPRRARVPVTVSAYVPDPLATADLRVTAETATAIADAEREIAATQQHAATVGTRTIAHQVLRSEAIASSQMEGVVVPSNRTIAKSAVSGRHHENARSAREAIEAVVAAYEWAADEAREPYEPAVLLGLHAGIARSDRRLAATAGAFREEQNWIGPDPYTPKRADFVPPPIGELPRLLDDLVDFLGRRDLSPVLQAAAVHAQFETIHPFADGNGRVGRMLIGMALARGGLVRDVVPPVSLVLAREREAYVAALTAWRYDDDGVDRWVTLLANALEETAIATRQLADDIAALRRAWRSLASDPAPGDATSAVIDILPTHPVINAEIAAETTGRSRRTAERVMARLQDRGVLQPVTLGRRNRAWESVGHFALLDRFERSLSGGAVGIGETR